VLTNDVTLLPTHHSDDLVEAANLSDSETATRRPTLPGYVSPSIEILYYPERPNLFDGFTVSGRAWGSELQGAFAYVTIAGVTRRAKICDGLWTVIFEDGALPKHFSGNKEIVAQFRDNLDHIARASVTVYVEEFIDSFITVDNIHKVVGHGTDAELHISGELNLGTHQDGRELIVLLERDDANVADPDYSPQVVAAGKLSSGWHHGEWRARISLAGVKSGAFRVRAQLLDCANTALTRAMRSQQVILK